GLLPAKTTGGAGVLAYGTKLKIASGILVIAIAMGIALWATKAAPRQMAAPSTTARTQAPAIVAPAAAVRTNWNFDTADQMSAFEGDLSSVSFLPNGGVNGSGCLQVRGDLRAKFRLPLTELPLVMTMRVFMGDLKRGQSNAWMISWSGQDGIHCHVHNEIFTKDTQWVTLRVYIDEKSIDGWFQNQRIFLNLTQKSEAALDFRMLSRGVLRIDDLEIRSLDGAEL